VFNKIIFHIFVINIVKDRKMPMISVEFKKNKNNHNNSITIFFVIIIFIALIIAPTMFFSEMEIELPSWYFLYVFILVISFFVIYFRYLDTYNDEYETYTYENISNNWISSFKQNPEKLEKKLNGGLTNVEVTKRKKLIRKNIQIFKNKNKLL
jgi:hypothetical protein